MGAGEEFTRRLEKALVDVPVGRRLLYDADRRTVVEAIAPVVTELTVPRADVLAALEGIYEDARGAVTAPVHHALMGAAQRLERLLGIDPGTPDYTLIGGGS